MQYPKAIPVCPLWVWLFLSLSVPVLAQPGWPGQHAPFCQLKMFAPLQVDLRLDHPSPLKGEKVNAELIVRARDDLPALAASFEVGGGLAVQGEAHFNLGPLKAGDVQRLSVPLIFDGGVETSLRVRVKGAFSPRRLKT